MIAALAAVTLASCSPSHWTPEPWISPEASPAPPWTSRDQGGDDDSPGLAADAHVPWAGDLAGARLRLFNDAWLAKTYDGAELWQTEEGLVVVDGDAVRHLGFTLEDLMKPPYGAAEGIAFDGTWIAWVGTADDPVLPTPANIYQVRADDPESLIVTPLSSEGSEGNFPSPDARFHVTVLGDYVYWQEAILSDSPRGNGQFSVAVMRQRLGASEAPQVVAEDAWYPTADRCSDKPELVYIHDDFTTRAEPRDRSVEAVVVAGADPGERAVLYDAPATMRELRSAAACGAHVIVGGIERPPTAGDEQFLEWGHAFAVAKGPEGTRELTWDELDTYASGVGYMSASADGAAFRVHGLRTAGRDFWWPWGEDPLYLTDYSDTNSPLQAGNGWIGFHLSVDETYAGPWAQLDLASAG